MKFKSQHRRFKVWTPGKSDPVIHGAHRVGKSIYVTSPNGNIIMQRVCNFVSEAKAFMANPSIN